ncbi:GNAT family N-acetyltransferase [Winogradskyella sp. PC-19]|uniref:GNAT family N-acetyltransferase n=1 Tax=unclassified Winogradskyella TaxID=2615021 RepID=UPI000B3BE79B|nr:MULTISPECIES: GNAT family N-acetyltransferase [unclassified Winogradskyella]ARV10258.1 GNAT family N-acetyltransferase [Winogradskyella sp. PC-19]RZN78566.1 MAG: GNAT family N-acetyltransferase [Winogradskyella sp.]
MDIHFGIVEKNNMDSIIPLVFELNEGRISEATLKLRFDEMIHQNYECAAMYDGNVLIGISGLWFCTRHYSGKSVELDHVYISPEHRNKGLGKQFMDWVKVYCTKKGCESIELNTYVNNYPSHKFYYNEGMEILCYHFFKHL